VFENSRLRGSRQQAADQVVLKTGCHVFARLSSSTHLSGGPGPLPTAPGRVCWKSAPGHSTARRRLSIRATPTFRVHDCVVRHAYGNWRWVVVSGSGVVVHGGQSAARINPPTKAWGDDLHRSHKMVQDTPVLTNKCKRDSNMHRDLRCTPVSHHICRYSHAHLS
jgi:hypothetical protein